jgi:hypothetical protein
MLSHASPRLYDVVHRTDTSRNSQLHTQPDHCGIVHLILFAIIPRAMNHHPAIEAAHDATAPPPPVAVAVAIIQPSSELSSINHEPLR